MQGRGGGGAEAESRHAHGLKRLNLLDHINFLASKEEGGIPGREKGALLEGGKKKASVRV